MYACAFKANIATFSSDSSFNAADFQTSDQKYQYDYEAESSKCHINYIFRDGASNKKIACLNHVTKFDVMRNV